MGEFVKCDISGNELFLDLQANVNIFFFFYNKILSNKTKNSI